MKIIMLSVGQMQSNCYLVANPTSSEAVIIDPGDDAQLIIDTLEKENLTPTAMLATHGHFDHLMAAYELQQAFDIPFFVHKADEFLVKRMSETAVHFLGAEATTLPPQNITYLDVKKVYSVGDKDYTLKIIETPGHTPGSVCFYAEKAKTLFCGDLIFAGGGFGRTDFKYSSALKLFNSIDEILKLPEDILICCGHGESTTVRKEKRQWKGKA